MTLTRRNLILTTGGALVSQALPAMASGTKTIGGSAFGSWWRASLPETADAVKIRAEIEAVIDLIEDQMSPFRPLSEISRLNEDKTDRWMLLSADVHHVVAESLRIARLTGGAFDPTVGPIVQRFGFGPIRGAENLNYGTIHLGKGGLRKGHPEATLDLCGIAKGYALDRMAVALMAGGQTSFLLEAGGEVLARGRHPSGRAWQVGVETPGSGEPRFQRIVALEGRALATSGQGDNLGTVAGVAFSHIIDPAIARPIVNDITSVSVIAPLAMTADALATALLVLGPKRGPAFANRLGVSALFQIRPGGGISEILTGQFAQHLVA